MRELELKVIEWASNRCLLFEDNANNQLLKSFEEMGELASALLKNDKEKIIDGIGDVLVTLIILANTKGLDLELCLNAAYLEIKDRKGITTDGTFVKNVK